MKITEVKSRLGEIAAAEIEWRVESYTSSQSQRPQPTLHSTHSFDENHIFSYLIMKQPLRFFTIFCLLPTVEVVEVQFNPNPIYENLPKNTSLQFQQIQQKIHKGKLKV